MAAPRVVYFVQRADGDIKIGFIVQWGVKARLAALWREHGELRLLGVIDGGREVESSLHSRFVEYRRLSQVSTRKHYTEWFAPAAELLKFIAAEAHSFSSIEGFSPRSRSRRYRVGVGEILVYEPPEKL